MATGEDPIVQAINDLTRVTLALHGGFGSKSEAVRRMSDLAIPPARIAAIMAMPTKDVSSILSQDKKRKAKKEQADE